MRQLISNIVYVIFMFFLFVGFISFLYFLHREDVTLLFLISGLIAIGISFFLVCLMIRGFWKQYKKYRKIKRVFQEEDAYTEQYELNKNFEREAASLYILRVLSIALAFFVSLFFAFIEFIVAYVITGEYVTPAIISLVTFILSFMSAIVLQIIVTHFKLLNKFDDDLGFYTGAMGTYIIKWGNIKQVFCDPSFDWLQSRVFLRVYILNEQDMVWLDIPKDIRSSESSEYSEAHKSGYRALVDVLSKHNIPLIVLSKSSIS
jgi:hypothetical protein